MPAIFPSSSSYNKDANFSEVKFGEDSPLLESELNEMQKISRTKLSNFISTHVKDGIYKQGTTTYIGGVFTISNEKAIVGGELIDISSLSLTVSEGESIYIDAYDLEATYENILKSKGNQQEANTITNYLLDSRVGVETTRRVVLAFTLSKTNSTPNHIFLKLGTITGGVFVSSVNILYNLTDHLINTSPHGAVSTATPSTLMIRDSSGRAKVVDPSTAQDIATKGYVDGAVSGASVKASCRVATTANITLSGTQTIDGVAVIAGNRVLVKNQTTGSQNGIYVVASGAWARGTDADTGAELLSAFSFVTEGSVNANSGWRVTTTGTITIDSTTVDFTQFSGAGQIVDGAGLTKTGNTMEVNVDGVGLEIASDILRLKDAGTTDAKLGSRTADQAIATAFSSTGTLSQLLSWIAKAIKNAVGKANWYDAPTNSLESVNTTLTNLSNSKGVANGLGTLDSSTKQPLSEVRNDIVFDNTNFFTSNNIGNAYVISTGRSLSSIANGMTFKVKCNANSTGNISLTVDLFTTKYVKDVNGSNVYTWKTNGIYTLIYDGTDFRQIGTDLLSPLLINTGDIPYASAPNVVSRLGKSGDGKVLKLVNGLPSWQDTLKSEVRVDSIAWGGIQIAPNSSVICNVTTGFTPSNVRLTLTNIPQWDDFEITTSGYIFMYGLDRFGTSDTVTANGYNKNYSSGSYGNIALVPNSNIIISDMYLNLVGFSIVFKNDNSVTDWLSAGYKYRALG